MKTRRDARSRQTLLQQRLALRIVHHHDHEAAQVLGDRMMELGISQIETGRKRRVPFTAEFNFESYDKHFARLLNTTAGTPQIRNYLRNIEEGPARFGVMGREVLLGIPNYASVRTPRAWSDIEASWVTSDRDIYHQLQILRLLPAKSRLGEMFFSKNRPGDHEIRINIFENNHRLKRYQWLIRLQRPSMRYRI
jgi:hypothetical protein